MIRRAGQKSGRLLTLCSLCWLVAAVLVAAVGAPAGAAPAAHLPLQGDQTGTGSVAQTIPAGGFVVSDDPSSGQSLDPVSCVPGTTFCVAVVDDTAVTDDSGAIGQGDLVTTDAATWSGFADLPPQMTVTSISCASETDCWVAGEGDAPEPQIAQSTDGGQTWTLETPAAWLAAPGEGTWVPNAIDCVDTTTCYIVGASQSGDADGNEPAAALTTDGGSTWSMISNLPPANLPEPEGDYALDGISCTSDLSCLAVGGLNAGDGTAMAISTVDGGASWSVSDDPTLQGIQQMFSVSCVPTASLPECTGVGSALEASGPVALTSDDGGDTWSGSEFDSTTDWLSSVSCPAAGDCWAAAAGPGISLAGTTDAGGAWSDTAGTSDEGGSVSCAALTLCIATNDNTLWLTTDFGGLASSASVERAAGAGVAGGPARSPAVPRLSRVDAQPLPAYSPDDVDVRTGSPATAIVGQDRASEEGSGVTVTVTPPGGSASGGSTNVQLNDFYSWSVADAAEGTTTVQFAVGGTTVRDVTVNAYPDAAPTVRSVEPAAGPEAGGNRVTILGSGFSGSTGVDFGSKEGSSLRIVSATELTVVAPAGAQVQNVTVTTSGGGPSLLSAAARYSYAPLPQVLSLSPATGDGGTVRISGPGLAWATGVRFGGRAATGLRLLSATTISVSAPPGDGSGVGTVPVVVTTAGGTTPPTLRAVYTYQGYLLATRQGGVFGAGTARTYGDLEGQHLNAPIVAMAVPTDRPGYWLVGADGGVYSFGGVKFYGSLGAQHLNAPIVGMAATGDGKGYWLFAADGGVFAFGDARYHGSLPADGVHVGDVRAMISTADGRGYWLIGADGGVFTFGDARYKGSLPGDGARVDDIVGMVPAPGATGYLLVGADGGVFVFGTGAPYHGSLPGDGISVDDVVGIALTPDAGGYWTAEADGRVQPFGGAAAIPAPEGLSTELPVVAIASI
jgi:hypothetical protein